MTQERQKAETPDTQHSDWREQVKGSMSTVALNPNNDKVLKESTDSLIDFIASEKSKSYEEGKHQFVKEILNCVTAEGRDCYFLRVAKDSPIFTQLLSE